MLTEWRQRSVLCLQVFSCHPQIATVIRLSRGHLLPASRPAGHNLRLDWLIAQLLERLALLHLLAT
ncbi:hypothetical protein LF1_54140 [Rubripirellula obstinata]|uniref:Uncharacterized protein n=1 Tax=Rubripirellula obstinata TaxID=406547 RepID=A0A5B1CBB7_9BACT|nr:hypothetical protein LF1_54140 [Rubripirellula obstinata]